jgi:RNA polymerase sigma-70 factor, ECF subfamily
MTCRCENTLADAPSNLERKQKPDGQPHKPFRDTEADLSDEALLLRASAGNKEALSSLFRKYARLIRSLASKILRDPFEADDLVQDTFLAIHRKCTTFDSSKGSARSWILQMAYHRAISRRRYLNCRHFYTAVELDDAENGMQKSGREAGRLEQAAERWLEREDLQKLFEALTENQRLTLRLYFFEGYTLEEIAKEIVQTKDNVRHHYFRGLEKLRKQILSRQSRR